MNIRLSAAMMAFLTTNILILLTTLILRNTKVLIKIGYQVLTFVFTLIILRMVFQREFFFTVSVRFSHRYPSLLLSALQHPYGIVAGMDISIWFYIKLFWMVGTFFFFASFFWKYYRLQKQLKANMPSPNEAYYRSLLDSFCASRKRRNTFRIVESKGVSIPCVFGIWHPYILMPANCTMSEEDLKNILCHEASHYFNHDLLLKFLINCVVFCYWWNPASWILRNQADTILDMRIDRQLTRANKTRKVSYVQSLIHVLESLVEPDETALIPVQSLTPYSVSMCKDATTVSKRCEYMLEDSKKNRMSILLIGFLALFLFVSSYFVVFEAGYMPPEIADTTMGSNNGIVSAIKTVDGDYEMYYNDFYLETVHSLDGFYPVFIYDESGEIIYEKK